jgi:hypothetical protein
MARLYGAIGLTLLLLLSVLTVVVVGVGHNLRGYELAVSHYDDITRRYSLRFLDINTGIMLLIPFEGGYWLEVDWSPDGEHLALHYRDNDMNFYVSIGDTYGEIIVTERNVSSSVVLSEERILLWDEQTNVPFHFYNFDPVIIDSQSAGLPHPNCWNYRISPDQRYIACLSAVPPSTYTLHVVDIVGNQEPFLVTESTDFIEIDWSPDSQMLLYSAYGQDNNRHMYIIDIDSKVVRQLSADADWATYPRWSPRGVFANPHFAFITVRPSIGLVLRIMDIEGNVYDIDLSAITSEGSTDFLAMKWSSDGAYIVVEASDLFLINLADAVPIVRRLTYDGSYNFSAWRPLP